MPDNPPRRRVTDRDRRRWNDQALSLLGKRVESHAEEIEDLRAEHRAVTRLPGEFAAFRREFDEWKLERRQDIEEFRRDIADLQREQRELFQRNFREHKKVQDTTEEIATRVTRTRWDKAKDMALILSLLLMPILTTYGLSR